jgi:hypothetical protein
MLNTNSTTIYYRRKLIAYVEKHDRNPALAYNLYCEEKKNRSCLAKERLHKSVFPSLLDIFCKTDPLPKIKLSHTL